MLGVGCWWLPTLINYFDDGAEGTVGDDALSAALDGRYMRGLFAVPTSEGTETEGLTYPQHIVAIAFRLLILIGIELRLFQLQLFVELAIEVERLSFVKVDTDAVEFAFEIDTMMMLDIIGIGGIATSCDRFDEVVLLVFLQTLVLGVAQYHFRKNAGGVGARFALSKERHRVLFLLLAFEVGQKAELVEGLVLIEIVELARYLLTVDGDECRTDIAIRGKIDDHRFIVANRLRGIAHADRDGLLGKGCQRQKEQ